MSSLNFLIVNRIVLELILIYTADNKVVMGNFMSVLLTYILLLQAYSSSSKRLMIASFVVFLNYKGKTSLLSFLFVLLVMHNTGEFLLIVLELVEVVKASDHNENERDEEKWDE